MIPLGLKETKEVDFFEQFSDFILEHYSVDPTTFEDAILDLIDTRQVGDDSMPREFGIVPLKHYYINRLRVRQREMRMAWICCANITTFSTLLSDGSFPSTETLVTCTSSGMTH